VKTAAAMAACGFDLALVDDLLDEFEEISERGCHVFEMHFSRLLAQEDRR